MVGQVIILAIVSLLAASLGALIAVRLQNRYWKNIHAQHEGWEHAQQGHHRSWEEKQEKLIAGAEARFIAQVQQLHNDWRQWEAKDAERIIAGIRQQERAEELSRQERELARLPRVEETSMLLSGRYSQGQATTHWRPALLQGANLTDHDLSYRYLGRADLRDAKLSRTNFFMADLSGACLADADLSEADLSCANLANADLRGAQLAGANLLVADLNNAILTGANLLGARNLTTQQVYTAIYDSTTQLDAEIDITLPRTNSVRSTHSVSHDFPSTPPDTEVPSQDAAPLLVEATLMDETLSVETSPASDATETPSAETSPASDATETPSVETSPASDATETLLAETTPPLPIIEPLSAENTPASVANELPLEQTTSPETPLSDATHEETSLPQQEADPTLTSIAQDEKKLPQEEGQLLVDIRESQHTKKPEKTPPRSKYNGGKRAKVGG
jgi:Pentapeptide repeats (8 copies)